MTADPIKLDISNLYIDSDSIGAGTGIFTFPNSTWGTNDMHSYMLGKLEWHWNLEDDDAGPDTTTGVRVIRNDWHEFEIEFHYEEDPNLHYIPRGKDWWLVNKAYLTSYTFTIRKDTEDEDDFEGEVIISGTVEMSTMSGLNELLDRITAWLNESTEPAEVTRQQRRKAEREVPKLRDH